MSISLTESAATRVRTFLEKRGHGVGLRLGVRKSGCNGWAYTIDYADSVTPDDVVFEQGGVKVIVAAESLELIDGTEVDFVKDGLERGVQVPQPQRQGRVRLRRKFQRLTGATGFFSTVALKVNNGCRAYVIHRQTRRCGEESDR